MIKFKSNLFRYLVKTFLFALFLILIARLFEGAFLGSVVITKYWIIVLWPIGITFIVWFSERSSLKEIEISQKSIRVTSNKGDSLEILWEAVAFVRHREGKRFFSKSVWAFLDKEGSEIYIPGGILSHKDEDRLTGLIKKRVSENNLEIKI